MNWCNVFSKIAPVPYAVQDYFLCKINVNWNEENQYHSKIDDITTTTFSPSQKHTHHKLFIFDRCHIMSTAE